MAGTQINDYGVGDTNLTSLMNTADTQRIGYHSVSLTNYATTTVPAIAEGSVIEINGALFEFQADEAISGSPANGTVYIKLTPSGTSVTAAFSTVAPSWDDEKQGWYEAATNKRYLNFGMIKSGASYTKYHLIAQGTLEIKAYPTGNLQCDDLQCDDLHVDGDIIITGEVRNASDVPIFGYMEDGTKLYSKWLTGTISNGAYSVGLAHGVASAQTNVRIVSLTAHIILGTVNQVSFNADYSPSRTSYNDTNIIVSRSTSTNDRTVYCFIVYK